MDYSELIEANRRLKEAMGPVEMRIAVLANVTIDPIKEILEYGLRSRGISAEVRIGAFDDIVQGSGACEDCKAVLVFWELATILDGLHSKGVLLDDSQAEEMANRLRPEIAAVAENLSGVPIVLFNLFSPTAYTAFSLRDGPLDG